MIYIDTSVALANLLAGDRQPPGSLWEEPLLSGRLLQYGMWILLHARGLVDTRGQAVRRLTGRVAMLDLPPVGTGPGAVRTLDGLHLASCAYLGRTGTGVMLPSYGRHMNAVTRAMDISLFDLEAS
ncbi:MAG: hypothetical protein OXH14_10695 [Alphaproteobacteria bacterium]|nr:hypothetical protein [Alphaproteobacteria bacterium]